jgi:hypothetical protein
MSGPLPQVVSVDGRSRLLVAGGPFPIASVEWGRYEGDRWICVHPVPRSFPESEGEGVYFLEPGVMRVVLVSE